MKKLPIIQTSKTVISGNLPVGHGEYQTHVHMEKRTSFKNLLPVCLKENEIIFHEIYEDLPDEFSHVHAGDHLLKDLLAGVDGHFILIIFNPMGKRIVLSQNQLFS